VDESDRSLVSSVVGQGRRRGFSVLMPFDRTAEGVVKAVRSVRGRSEGRVYLKGDGRMAALALELMSRYPKLFSGASAVALSGPVPEGLSRLGGGEADIVVAAGDPAQVRAGFEAFNRLAAPADRVDGKTVEEIARSGKVPPHLGYSGPYDHDFPAPNRVLALRRESGAVRLSVTAGRSVTAFDPSFGWIAGRTSGQK
jgi:hypothetical protein